MARQSVTIPVDLWERLAVYVLDEDTQTESNRQWLIQQIEAKLDRDLNHDLYTQYKTAPTEEQREKARKEYLDNIGMRQGFRW